MKRIAGFLLAFTLLTGFAAGCSSDDDGDAATTEQSADNGSSDNGSSDEGSTSGNADVAAYCEAVDAFVEKALEAADDPAKAAGLATEGQDLTEKATALSTAGLSAEEAQEVADCTERSTEALQSLIPG